jgi:uncharacterized protein YbaR (Trm112 family)
MTNKERLEDLLIEFDEFGMEPTILIPKPVERAREWKHELEYAIEHLEAEVAKEIFDLIEDECLAYPIQEGHPTILVDARNYNELKKKYTEEVK